MERGKGTGKKRLVQQLLLLLLLMQLLLLLVQLLLLLVQLLLLLPRLFLPHPSRRARLMLRLLHAAAPWRRAMSDAPSRRSSARR